MRKVLYVLLAAALCAALAGCRKKEAAAESGPETIEMWGWNAGEIEKLMAAYKEQTGADIILNYSAVAQAEAFQKLQTVVSSGLDVPDVVPSEVGQRGTMVGLDIWHDLEKEPFNFDVNIFYPYQQALCRNEAGKLVALPLDTSSAALAYKRDLAEKYLGTSDPAELEKMMPTWNDFVEKGKQVQSASGNKIFMFASLTNIYQIGSGQNPTPIVRNNKFNMTPVNAIIEQIVRFRDNRTSDNIIEGSPAYNASYVDDTHIFYPCAGWSPNYQIKPNDPDGPTHVWGLMVPPEGCFSWGGTANMVPQKAKHALAGFKFISWIISKEGAIWAYDNLDWNCSNVEAYKEPRLANATHSYFGDQNLGAVLYGAIDTINVRPVSPYDVILLDTFNLVVENLNSDRNLTAEKAIALFETEFRNKAPDVQ
jgi:multiple sugar transport system substrate-binding protein